MKRILAVLALCSIPAFAADMSKPMKIAGYISESSCGATHNSATPDKACVDKCLAKGAKPVFVDDEKKKVWAIDNPDAIKGDEGKPVTIVATADEAAMSVHIEKVSKVGIVKAPASSMKMN